MSCTFYLKRVHNKGMEAHNTEVHNSPRALSFKIIYNAQLVQQEIVLVFFRLLPPCSPQRVAVFVFKKIISYSHTHAAMFSAKAHLREFPSVPNRQ
jgi:hypothetical protein